jgi:hypothetical protein
MDKFCWLGEKELTFEYWTAKGKSPRGAYKGEDCLMCNPKTLKTLKKKGQWVIVSDCGDMLYFGDNKKEAGTALSILKRYGFTRQCTIGSGEGATMTYYRR